MYNNFNELFYDARSADIKKEITDQKIKYNTFRKHNINTKDIA